jgi:hypothetical protein
MVRQRIKFGLRLLMEILGVYVFPLFGVLFESHDESLGLEMGPDNEGWLDLFN